MCVTKLCVMEEVEEAEEAEEEDPAAEAAGYRIKNKNPTQRCGEENTNTNTPSPERANPARAREKKKRTDDGPNTDQRRGADGSA